MSWLLRAAWLSLPLTAGPAADAALDGWTQGPRTVAAALLWAAWAVVLVGLLSPRPLGLTALRLVAPSLFAAAVAAAPASAALPAAAGLGVTALLAGLALLPETAEVLVNGAAYGDERRFPLRTPRVVAGAAAVSVPAIAAGAAAGPLLLADGRWAVGVPVAVVGITLAAFLSRSVHALSLRWLVRVPGGLVVHDPLVLADPVLLPRERIARVEPRDERQALDLRLGAVGGAVTVFLTDPIPFAVVQRDRRSAEMADARAVTVAVTRPGSALRAVHSHRRARTESS